MKSVWTAEESQAMAMALRGPASSEVAGLPNSAGGASLSGAARKAMEDMWREIHRPPQANGGGGSGKRPQRPQPRSRETAVFDFAPDELGLNRGGGGSSIAAATAKTLEDVWREIHRAPESNGGGGGKRQHRQSSGGEMTLEDFLSRVARQETDAAQLNPCASSVPAPPLAMVHPSGMQALALQNRQSASWVNYGLQQTKSIGSGHGYSDSIIAPLRLGPNSSFLPITDSPTGQIIEKDDKDSLFEKSLERRKARMIKNRESAARSRARKQAYTVELEAEVTLLKEENTRLKKQQALGRQLLPPQDPQQPIRVLRRTRSSSW